MVASHDRTGFFLTRRRTLALGALVGGLAVLPRTAKAVVRLDITEGNFRPLPIAIPEFFAAGLDGGGAANAVTQIITANLQRSGLLAPIDPAAYIERIPSFEAVPRFPDWRNINAQALVTGQIGRQTNGRLQAKFRLWDVLGGQQLDGKQYDLTTPDNWRRIAHIISDAIYERLTGEGGYFDSHVVFVDETGPRERRVKRLAIMDQDGANVRYLTRGDELVLTPRFSPSTQEIIYMAYGQGDPRVYLYNSKPASAKSSATFPA
jgi:TolB protein